MKNTYVIHSIITSLFLCNVAHGKVVLIEDSSTKDGYYMAKVITVKLIIEKVPYMTVKNYCQKDYGTTHYSGPGTNTLALGMTPPLSTPSTPPTPATPKPPRVRFSPSTNRGLTSPAVKTRASISACVTCYPNFPSATSRSTPIGPTS